MTRFYSDPSREDGAWSLPDCEAFYAEAGELTWEDQQETSEAGWYFWFCYPGYMPDSEPSGPYSTEAEAIAAARDMAGD